MTENPSDLINKADGILVLGKYEMHQKYMAMPTLAVLYPVLRYLLLTFFNFSKLNF